MQQQVEDFIKEYQLSCGEKVRYMDLVSEIGELGKEIIKSTSYGKEKFNLNEAVIEEMGDCIFSMLALCVELEINSNEALKYAIEKYESRFQQTSCISSGK